MKAKEVRIGNYISDKYDNVLEVIGAHHKAIYSIYPNYLTAKNTTTTDPTEIKPIQLTEEWLLKFGFEIEYRNWYKLSYHSKYYILANESHDHVELCVNDICGSQPECKYVHQL